MHRDCRAILLADEVGQGKGEERVKAAIKVVRINPRTQLRTIGILTQHSKCIIYRRIAARERRKAERYFRNMTT
jgi:hypothetical protein